MEKVERRCECQQHISCDLKKEAMQALDEGERRVCSQKV